MCINDPKYFFTCDMHGCILASPEYGYNYVCKMAVSEGRIFRNPELLSCFDLVEDYFYWILHVVQ